MKESDPSVIAMCAGSMADAGQQMPGVRPYLLEQAGDYLDYVSVHSYWLPRAASLRRYDYLTAICKAESPEVYIGTVINSLKKQGRGNLKISHDEWNLRAWQHPGFPRNKVEDYEAPEVRALVEQRRAENDLAEQYTMADALFSASFLNACFRHCEHVTMAAVAPLVNTRGPLFVHPKGIVKRTHYHAMWMYANLLQDRVVHAKIESESLSHNGDPVARLDGVVTVDETGKKWAISLVNRDPVEALFCAVKIGDEVPDGSFNATVLDGDSPDAYNDTNDPGRVEPRKSEVHITKGVVELAPHSLTIVDVDCQH